MIFTHTSREPRLWRGWLKNGQSVEISRSRRGWDFGLGVHIHINDDDRGDRMLFLEFWRLTVILPLGVIDHPWSPMEGPGWSIYASSEFGLTVRWNMWHRSFQWPWTWHTISYEKQTPAGFWRDVFDLTSEERKEVYPYRYILRSGAAQDRTATVSKRRHVLTYRGLRWLGWPRWTKESIEVEFDDEVGERTGSWKGGCIGCGYDLRTGETMLDCLRRMEREREFR